MLRAVEQTARSAVRAWRRARGIEGALVGLSVGLFGLALTALMVELSSGLEGRHLGPLLAWLLAAPIGGLARAVQPIALGDAATEADHRAGLSDRLGTALEFAEDPSPIAALQRSDAHARAQGLAVGALFPIPWRRYLPRLAVLLFLALLATGAALTFQLRPERSVAPAPGPDTDLLATIERAVEDYEERGDKEAVRLLTDLDRTIRRIKAREAELRKVVKARQLEAPPPDPELADEPLPPPPPRREPEGPRITADDLTRLEEATAAQLDLTDAQQAEIVSDLFSHTRKADDLMKEFHHHAAHEVEVDSTAENVSSRSSTAMDSGSGIVENEDLVANAALTRQTNNGLTKDIASEREGMIRREINDESMNAHEKSHETQESFNQFLRDFVKDVQDIVAEAAVGKNSKKKGPEVQVNNGQGIEDKADAMAATGFKEMEETKRHEGQAAPEELAGSTQPAQGPPPEGAKMSQGSGTPKGPMMKGEGKGETSAGAQGAGTGGQGDNEGLATLLNGLQPQEGGRLEQALGQLAQGRMPPEEREALFDRLARHKVQAGLASEADDVLVDYFAEAEELMVANSDALPPLFRDYAQSYFDSIRPGASRP